MLRSLCLTLGLLLALPVQASGFDDALRAFAADVSGGDKQVAARVEQIIAQPPKTTEEIGFYGVSDKGVDERKFRAVIFQLSEAGYILGFEDKYIHELATVLEQEGWITNRDAPALMSQIEEAYIREDPNADVIATRLLSTGFIRHVAKIEAGADEIGRTLLYIDLPVGDTFHLVSLTNDKAAKWRDVVFVKTPRERFAVTGPQWDIYYSFLTYALLLDAPAPSPVLPYKVTLRSLQSLGY